MSHSQDERFSRIAALRPRVGSGVLRADAEICGERDGQLLRLLGAELRRTPRGRHLAVTVRIPDPGLGRIGDRACRLLAPHAPADTADTSRWIFLDTETTGLAGGTGTYAFLVGLAWWEEQHLVIEQLFMRDHSEEPSLLHDLGLRFAEKSVLVTFNGKSFDWPLLETRFRMTRSAAVRCPEAHLDLLHPSRQLWKFRLKSVALSELEKHVLDFDRGPDIPSSSIPGRYFDFLRGGPADPIAEIFRHNLMDLRGLAALAGKIARLLEGPMSEGDAAEVFGVSRILQCRGEWEPAGKGYRKALSGSLPPEAERIARRELALLARRQRDYATANAMWEMLLGDTPSGIFAYSQLAIHCEHRAQDCMRAGNLAREALVRLREGYLAGRIEKRQYERWHESFRRRLARLERKSAPGDGSM